MRVNARLEPEVAEKLRLLKATTGASTSDVLKRAIDVYYQQRMGPGRSPYTALQAAGLLACADGPADLSRDYKAELAKRLGSKHGHR
jgi:hypothetical protein